MPELPAPIAAPPDDPDVATIVEFEIVSDWTVDVPLFAKPAPMAAPADPAAVTVELRMMRDAHDCSEPAPMPADSAPPEAASDAKETDSREMFERERQSSPAFSREDARRATGPERVIAQVLWSQRKAERLSMVRSARVTRTDESAIEILCWVEEPVMVSNEVSGRSACVPLQVRSTDWETVTGPAEMLQSAIRGLKKARRR
jgi:hypothetical protein